MDQTIWNFIFIGITFGVYIGIAIWSRAGSTEGNYTAGEVFPRLQMVWPPLQTDVGCHFYFYGRRDCCRRIWSVQIPYGMDGRLCSPNHPYGALPEKIRQSHSTRFCW